MLVLAPLNVVLGGPPWSDASSDWWTDTYHVSAAQVATVADGYPDGTFRPANPVTRVQFAKMAITGLGLDTASPVAPTFMDVIPSQPMYQHVEGAYSAGLIEGCPASDGLSFKPQQNISRQQANSILGHYLSDLEINLTRAIHGDVLNWGSLDLWYKAEGSFYTEMVALQEPLEVPVVHAFDPRIDGSSPSRLIEKPPRRPPAF